MFDLHYNKEKKLNNFERFFCIHTQYIKLKAFSMKLRNFGKQWPNFGKTIIEPEFFKKSEII